MIFKILIIAAIGFYIRLIFKKTSNAQKPLPKKKKSKDDSIEAEYEVVD